MMIIVKSLQSGKFRQRNNTWSFDKEHARRFFPTEPSLNWYRNYPTYYELVEIKH